MTSARFDVWPLLTFPVFDHGEQNMRLRNKVAVMTDAGTGIREVIWHQFAKEETRLLVSGARTDLLHEVAHVESPA
jgi:hypothetical protein